MTHPWMEHDKTGHRAQLPDDPYWRAQGWAPCDGPHPEPDRLHDPAEPVLQDKPVDVPADQVTGEPAKPAGKPAKSEGK